MASFLREGRKVDEGQARTDAEVFDIAREPSMRPENFFVSNANRTAFELIADPESWPKRKLAIVGEACSGKTHLAIIWAHRAGAQIVPARQLDSVEIRAMGNLPGVAVDDSDAVSGSGALEEALLRLHNVVAECGGHLLLTARAVPSRWNIALPDLKSRLAATYVVSLGKPDDELLEALLIKHFSDRQIFVARGTITYILNRIERSCQAVQSVVAALDKLSLGRGRPLTRAVASELLSEAGQSGLA